VLIVAIPCAWLGDKIGQKRSERHAVETIRKLGGAVYYNLRFTQDFSVGGDSPGLAFFQSQSSSTEARVSISGTVRRR
jgi:hypothetical protein